MFTTRLVAALVLSLPLCLIGCGQSKEVESGTTAQGDDVSDHEEGEGHGAEAEGGSSIKLSVEAAQAAGIEIATSGPARIRETLLLYGTVKPNAERVRDITARFPGVIRSMKKQVGDAVKEGETLATIESDESLRTYAVGSPLSGIVTARSGNPGEKASEASLYTVADLASVWVELSLFPRDLVKVHTGQAVRIRSVDEGLTADGKIVYIASLGQSASQTLSARVVLQNTDRRWAPGLYVDGEVTLSEAEAPVAVKSSALQTVENAHVVFVQNQHGFTPQPVIVGRADSEYTEIRSGLEAGRRYAAANSFVLKSDLGKGEAGHED